MSETKAQRTRLPAQALEIFSGSLIPLSARSPETSGMELTEPTAIGNPDFRTRQ
jgi:hypothetical protein